MSQAAYERPQAAQTFFKRTRKGKVVRIVEEKYMRDDAGCGFLCGKALSNNDLKKAVQEAPLKQLLVLDTNVLYHQLDLLEYKCPATSFVVILQTVLMELRHLNLSAFRRVCELLQDDSRWFIFFPNELVPATRTERLSAESANDKNDRSIRTAARWFNVQLDDVGSAIMITNDVMNRAKAGQEHIRSLSMQEYVRQFSEMYPHLTELLAATDDMEINDSESQHTYAPHLPATELATELKAGRLLKGVIRVRLDCWFDCYTVLDIPGLGEQTTVLVRGEENVNRSIDGDVCAFELLPRSEWTRTSTQLSPDSKAPTSIEGAHAILNEIELPEDLLEKSESQNIVPMARVRGVIRRKWKTYAGSLQEGSERLASESDTQTQTVLCECVEKRLPLVRIQTRQREALIRKRILVTIDAWPATSKYPLGHYLSTLGDCGDKNVETQVVLHEYNIPYESFSAKVMACVPSDDYEITDADMLNRVDLRYLPVLSIDPPGCKDIDDALHCQLLENGNLEIGVHIADVTHFVASGNALDEEAANRCTSTYLVGKRLDMLPGVLTEKLCSLRANVDRLAFSVVWEMTTDAEILDVRFHKSIIHSIAALTYQQAQDMLDDPLKTDPASVSVRSLNSIARILRGRRMQAGALTLASPEVRFELDSSTLDPTELRQYELKEANALVEEFMLLANITVAKKIVRHFPTLSVLRKHAPPSRSQFAPLISAAKTKGILINIDTSKHLADSLNSADPNSDPNAEGVNDPYLGTLLRMLSTRCMMPAQYICTGDTQNTGADARVHTLTWHHYGLAAPIYTHFTSPIRRYADVCTHRLLAAAIGVSPLPAKWMGANGKQYVSELCRQMNRRHKAAQYAQRASVTLHTLMYFRNRPNRAIAFVMGLQSDRFSVLIPKFGLEGQIPLQERLEQSYTPSLFTIHHSPETHTLDITAPHPNSDSQSGESEPNHTRISIFDRVHVLVYVVEHENGSRALMLDLLEPWVYPHTHIHTYIEDQGEDEVSALDTNDEVNFDESLKESLVAVQDEEGDFEPAVHDGVKQEIVDLTSAKTDRSKRKVSSVSRDDAVIEIDDDEEEEEKEEVEYIPTTSDSNEEPEADHIETPTKSRRRKFRSESLVQKKKKRRVKNLRTLNQTTKMI